MKDKLAEVSKAVALNNLTAIVSGLGRIKADLADINQVTRHLQGNASQLNSGKSLMGYCGEYLFQTLCFYI